MSVDRKDSITPPKGAATEWTSPQPDDFELVQRIALKRDEEAFKILFLRYRAKSYSLALHLLKNRTLAEDAVQEGMLRVWKSAKTIRSDGNICGWIMRTVSNACLNLNRCENRHDRRKAKVASDRPTTNNETLQAVSDGSEVMGKAREALSLMPEHAKQMIALRFGAGMTFAEISRATSVAERTVSFRLEKALKELRRNLGVSGTDVLLPVGLQSIVLGAYTPPPGMLESFSGSLADFAEVDVGTGLASSRTFFSMGWSIALIASVGVVVTAVLATTLSLETRSEPEALESGLQQSSKDQVSVGDVPQQGVGAGEAQKKFSNELPAYFDFSRKRPGNEFNFDGHWGWTRSKFIKSNFVELGTTKKFGHMILPLNVSGQPLRVDIKCKAKSAFSKGNACAMYLLWAGKDSLLYQDYEFPTFFAFPIDRVSEAHFYLFGRFIICKGRSYDRAKEVFLWGLEFETPYPGTLLRLVSTNMMIQNIRVSAISMEEALAATANPPTAKKSIHRRTEAFKFAPNKK